MDQERWIYLLERYAAGTLSDTEWRELYAAFQAGSEQQISEYILKVMENTAPDADIDNTKWMPILQAALSIDKNNSSDARIFHIDRGNIFKRSWFRYAAAAVFLLTIGSVTFLLNTRSDDPETKQSAKASDVQNDVMPGGNRAILTLADGSTIILDSVTDGALAKQGNTEVRKLSDGQLAYHSSGSGEAQVLINTVSTPRGGQYQLRLSDGTRVWLNAASSITYPVSFSGRERSVSITGEAYFEVTHDKTKPFIVECPAVSHPEERIDEGYGNRPMKITVLGTHFNVNAYEDEGAVKTSLLEGSVRVADKVLQPGQAFWKGKIVQTNIEQDVAWKNGAFNFSKADLKVVMRQLSRWYDVDVEYEGNLPAREFSGKISRDLQLMDLLDGLKKMNVKFRLDGKKLIVKS